MAKNQTILEKMRDAGPATAGFDYLRIGLALAVLVWHSIVISGGSASLDKALWSGPIRFLPAAILPMFFALSGFLVAGSLERTRLHQFVTLRVLRLVPALAVEVTLSALILGAIFTTLPLRDYLSSPELGWYFGNIVGLVHFTLPGVFENNPLPRFVNFQLWTIPFELECYLALIILAATALLRNRRAFVTVISLFSIAATAAAFLFFPVSGTDHVPGRVLVLSFLAAVSLHLYRDRIPYSPALGASSAIATAILLEIPDASYLAIFPVAYLTVWLGLMRPPAIPFGDLSYGVYLFHFPIEQSVVRIFPGIGSWWQVTLMAAPPTLLCAWISWNVIERPILTRKARILTAVDSAWAARGRLVGRRDQCPTRAPETVAQAE